MSFTLIDFFIGLSLMNAMPHILFGLLNIRFLSAFGFSARANLVYGFLNLALSLLLFHQQYGLQSLPSSGIIVGAGTVLFLYLVIGKFLYNLFQAQRA